ncbi:MAG: hypothetical protein QXO24_01975 [Candidatus Micrarchaeaceae archaeon]
MKRLISAKLAGNILLILFGALAVFHILILLSLLPSDIVWGGQAVNSSNSLRILEMVSLAFTILFAIVVAAKISYIKVGKFAQLVNVFLWFIFAYLLLNTLGNLASSSLTEKLIFTPITIIAAFLVLRLAIEK